MIESKMSQEGIQECKKGNNNSSTDANHKLVIRSRLPATMLPRDEVSLWSILKHFIGKELSKITFPIVFNEPISFLQRMGECMEYGHYLNLADECDDPLERMENVCAFIVASFANNADRMNKPFNPLLGETYELHRDDIGVRLMCEQVSHHPPVSAWHAESPHFQLNGSINPKLKFWGKSIEVKPDGTSILKLKKSGDVITWKAVNCCVHNIIVGKLWFEQYGTMEVKNHTNGMKASLSFKAAGWFGKDLHRLDGFILSKDNEKLRFLYGKWTDYLKSACVEDYDDYIRTHSTKFRVPDKPEESPRTARKVMSKLNSFTRQLTGSTELQTQQDGEMTVPAESTEGNGEIPKSDSSHSLDIPNSRILWQVDPRPEYSSKYYNFTLFTMALNQLDDALAETLPPTDSRFRPDMKKLEEGDIDIAATEKNRLEEKQREVRRIRKKRKESWTPLWFDQEVNPITKEEDWTFNEKYWQRDFSKCDDIF